MHRVGLAQLERGTEPDRLTHRHPGFHPGVPGERRALPLPTCIVGPHQRERERRELGLPGGLAAQREQWNPAARGAVARELGGTGHGPGRQWDPNISRISSSPQAGYWIDNLLVYFDFPWPAAITQGCSTTSAPSRRRPPIS